MTEKEKREANYRRQKEFRERMFAAGYKVRVIWVKREADKGKPRMSRRGFLGRLGELTAGMSDRQLSGLYMEILRFVKAGREGKGKER
jgi:hypothetical protein